MSIKNSLRKVKARESESGIAKHSCLVTQSLLSNVREHHWTGGKEGYASTQGD